MKNVKIRFKLNFIYEPHTSTTTKFILNFPQIPKIKYTKPPIKWLGGKTQLLERIMPYFPKEIDNYHELFLGGSSVLLAVLDLVEKGYIKIKGNIYAYDFNEILIGFFDNIKNHSNGLYTEIQSLKNIYTNLSGTIINRKPDNEEEAKTSKESYYYWCRKQFNQIENKQSIKSSALFLFLNKTCFRGVYRTGPNGFNVPYGHYKTTPTFIEEAYLNNLKKLIDKVQFKCLDFKEAFKNIGDGDFVYLDPPYAPENATSFVGYNKKGFKLEEHQKLFELTKNLDSKNARFIMSNSEVELVTDAFRDYKIKTFEAKRAINSKKPQSKTNEVIIHNLSL